MLKIYREKTQVNMKRHILYYVKKIYKIYDNIFNI